MSKLFKKGLLILISGVLVVSSLAGCSTKTQEGGNTVTTGQTTTTSKTAETTKDAPKPTLRSLQIWQKEDYNTYPVAQVIEDITGYKVEYETLPQDNAMDKLNLLIASGEEYDVVTIAGGSTNHAVYSSFAEKGALLELSPLMEQYGSNILGTISKDALNKLAVNEKIYGIPTIAIPFAGISILVRQDWMEQLGLSMPNSLDEFVTILKAFKDHDPGKNGKDKNMPLAVNGTGAMVANITGAFGIPNAWNEKDGILEPQVMDPAFKEYIEFMKGLYGQGLLDKEFATNKDATTKEKFTSGRAGAIVLGWYDVPPINEALQKNFPQAKTTYIPALTGAEGKLGLGVYAGVDRITFIPKSAKNPEHAMIWMNLKMEKDAHRLIAIGEEGKHFTIKEGDYYPILPIFADERDRANNFLTGADDTLYPIYWQARVRKNEALYEAWAYMNKVQPENSRVMDVLSFAPYLPEYSKYNQQLGTMLNDYAVKVIVGGESLDKLDSFITSWKSEGGQTSYDELNQWYKSYKAGQ